MPSSKWPTQNGLSDVFIDFLSHTALNGNYFCLTGLLFVYYDADSVFLWIMHASFMLLLFLFY